MQIDLNADLGEGAGSDEALLALVSSANIACGWHAGDAKTMQQCVRWAIQNGVAIGAHPSFPDRENFGRSTMHLPPDEIVANVLYQVGALAAIVKAEGGKLSHVKAHGQLYNQAVKERSLAGAIASGVAQARSESSSGLSPLPILVGLAGSPMLEVFRHAGFPVAAEAFADRRYEPDGTLRSRKFDDALVRDPTEAARQALSIAQRGIVIAHDGTEVHLTAQTICIHGDTPGAARIAAVVVQKLREAGILLGGLASRP